MRRQQQQDIARMADKQQRLALDAVFGDGNKLSSRILIYTVLAQGQYEPTPADIYSGSLSRSRKHVNPDKSWGIVLVGKAWENLAAEKIAAVLDLAGKIPSNVGKIVCAVEKDLSDNAKAACSDFLAAGGVIVYDEHERLTEKPVCDSSWFQAVYRHGRTVPEYVGPLSGRLLEVIRAEALEDSIYDTLDSITSIYVDCDVSFDINDLDDVTLILSYGQCSIFEIISKYTPIEYGEDMLPMQIARCEKNAQLKNAMKEMRKILEPAEAVARIWAEYAKKYSFGLHGWTKKDFHKWADLGELIGVRDAIDLYFRYGIPLKDITA